MQLAQIQVWLTQNAAVGALVGSKVFPLRIPDELPAPSISLKRASTQPINSLLGASGTDQSAIEISCWAQSYRGVLQLRDAVRVALQAQGLQLELETEEFDNVVLLYNVTQHWFLWI